MTKLQFPLGLKKNDKLLALLLTKGTYNPNTKVRYIKKENVSPTELGKVLGKARQNINIQIKKLATDNYIIDKGEVYEFPCYERGQYSLFDMELLSKMANSPELPLKAISVMSLMNKYKALSGTFTKKYLITNDLGLAYGSKNLNQLNEIIDYLIQQNYLGLEERKAPDTDYIVGYKITFVAEHNGVIKKETVEVKAEKFEPIVVPTPISQIKDKYELDFDFG